MVRKGGAFDLNRCTVRQLTQLSGIPLENARKLVRFRERQRRKARHMEEERQARLERRRSLREELHEEAQPRQRDGRFARKRPTDGETAKPVEPAGQHQEIITIPLDQDLPDIPELSPECPLLTGTEPERSPGVGESEPRLHRKGKRDRRRQRAAVLASPIVIVIEIKPPVDRMLRDQSTSQMREAVTDFPLNRPPLYHEEKLNPSYSLVRIKKSLPMNEQNFQTQPYDQGPPEPALLERPMGLPTLPAQDCPGQSPQIGVLERSLDPPTPSAEVYPAEVPPMGQPQSAQPGPSSPVLQRPPPHQCVSNTEGPRLGQGMQRRRHRSRHRRECMESRTQQDRKRNHRILERLSDRRRRMRSRRREEAHQMEAHRTHRGDRDREDASRNRCVIL